jgi:transcriptional regulator with GAF, ATPase, and Fis domain
MSSLSKLITADENVDSTVHRITQLAVRAIDGAEHASVSLATGGEIKTVAATSEVGNVIDRIQYETGEGPCLSSIKNQATFYLPDMSSDKTWPAFSKRAAEETGIKSLLGYVLKVHEDSLGALNVTSTKADAMDEEARSVGALFAAQAGVVLANAMKQEHDEAQIHNLNDALVTRQLIGQAVGIIMATRQVDAEAAFETLRVISQSTNIKVRQIAQELVERAADI